VERDEADLYFNAPDRDFRLTDEALRIRCIGPANYVTYKGPRRDTTTKTREEIELALPPGEAGANDFARLLERLGYRRVAEVRKHRAEFSLQRDGHTLHVCLDDVVGVGPYVELEIVAEESALAAAQATVLATAAELGLGPSERRSYLELYLTACGELRS
jgi:adenylate cyclase class 2